MERQPLSAKSFFSFPFGDDYAIWWKESSREREKEMRDAFFFGALQGRCHYFGQQRDVSDKACGFSARR